MSRVGRARLRIRDVSRSRAARSSSWSMMGQVAALLASTANFLLLARLVGPTDYGVIAGAWALVMTIGPVATLGADRLIVRDVSAHGGPPSAALTAALVTLWSGGLLTILALVLLHPVILPQAPLVLIAALAVAEILGTNTVGCLTAMYFATNQAKAAGIATTVASLAKLSAVVVFALTDGEDPVRWALLYVALSVITAILQAAWAFWRTGRPRLVDFHPLRRAREGLPYSGNAVALVAQNDADKTILVRYGYAEAAGLYSVAYRLVSMSFLPVLAVLQVTFPRFFTAGSEGGLEATRALSRRLMRPLALYGVLATGALIAAAPLIPVLVGEQYRGSIALLMLLAPLSLIRVAQSVSADALTGAGLQSTRTACVTASAVVNVALNLALIPRFGLAAALLATLVAEVLNLVLLQVALSRHTKSEERGRRDGTRPASPAARASSDA